MSVFYFKTNMGLNKKTDKEIINNIIPIILFSLLLESSFNDWFYSIIINTI